MSPQSLKGQNNFFQSCSSQTAEQVDPNDDDDVDDIAKLFREGLGRVPRVGWGGGSCQSQKSDARQFCNTGWWVCEEGYLRPSVTRHGEMSPLWEKLKNICQLSSGLF